MKPNTVERQETSDSASNSLSSFIAETMLVMAFLLGA